MYALHNEIIAKVPQVIKNSYIIIISSAGCTHRGYRLHFRKQGYKLLRARYAQAYLKLKGIDLQVLDLTFIYF